MDFAQLRPTLDNFTALLKAIERHTKCLVCGGTGDPIAATSVTADPATIAEGYNTIVVTKTNAPGTVTVTFPGGGTYVLSADGEEFRISGSPLGEYTITGAGGGEFKYYSY